MSASRGTFRAVLVGLVVGRGVVGCGSAESPPATPTEAPPTTAPAAPVEAPPDSPPVAFEQFEEIESNDGTYLVRYRLDPPAIPLNELFSIEAWVYERADPSRPLEEIELLVDGRMPDHRHGLNRTPTITATGGGRFEIDGMLFHMPGFWELHFDVTRGAMTERAQLEVRLR